MATESTVTINGKPVPFSNGSPIRDLKSTAGIDPAYTLAIDMGGGSNRVLHDDEQQKFEGGESLIAIPPSTKGFKAQA